MSPRKVRLSRIVPGLKYSSTWFTEISCGVGGVVVGVWVLMAFMPAPIVGDWLWAYAGPTLHGWLLIVFGGIQALGSCTKWVTARRVSAMAMATIWFYTLGVYWLTSRTSLCTPLMLGLVISECWVALRITFDGLVNGSDRRDKLNHGVAHHDSVP